MKRWIEEYAKHAALNFGQALHGLRFLLTHPKADSAAPPGSLRHAWRSLRLRVKLIVNDLFFALLPPRWHHTRAELASFHSLSLSRWFLAGYASFRFTETGELLPAHEAPHEARWDPRCDDA